MKAQVVCMVCLTHKNDTPPASESDCPGPEVTRARRLLVAAVGEFQPGQADLSGRIKGQTSPTRHVAVRSKARVQVRQSHGNWQTDILNSARWYGGLQGT